MVKVPACVNPTAGPPCQRVITTTDTHRDIADSFKAALNTRSALVQPALGVIFILTTPASAADFRASGINRTQFGEVRQTG